MSDNAAPSLLELPRSRALASATPLSRFSLLLDPDHFGDVAFFRELEAMGYGDVLLGGTGSHRLPALVAEIRRTTSLRVIVYPSGPDAVCEADLIVLPDIMNSRAPHARPFGPGAVMTALAIARTGCPWLSAAHFIQGQSTARWFYDAEPILDPGLLAHHCRYAEMVGYRNIALDYEDPATQVDIETIVRIKRSAPRCHLTVSDEASPMRALELSLHGVDTVILPSNVLEDAADPLALAQEYCARLLA
jgi:heptaprenylglyceryl phosphate synthase